MKRKIMMIGLAMATGLPHGACADSGNEDSSQAYSSWNTSYMPHYGGKGVEKPLMDHVSVASVSAPAGQGVGNTWRLQFTPFPAVSNADAPLTAKDVRAGFSLKLGF